MLHPFDILSMACTRCLCQENMCLLYGVCSCIDLKVQLITAVLAVLSKNNLTNVIIYPQTSLCFGRLGYNLLEFIIRVPSTKCEGNLL